MAAIYKLVELVGTSEISFAEAAKAAVAEAAKTLGHLDWFEVVKETGKIVAGEVKEFQVTRWCQVFCVNGHRALLILTLILVAPERRIGLCGDTTRAPTEQPGFGATGGNARSRWPAILAGK